MKRSMRCAIYTRKSSEEGLDQDFNSLDAQREACAAYVQSQRQEGWKLVATRYDDGGYSGGTLERPALQRLLADIDTGKVDLIVVYKIDRLTRALSDFAKLVERMDARNASFVSVTQSFNTTTSMGRLTLNVLLSFAQFEREVTGERIRDKIAASKQKGMWMGGCVPLGYDCVDRKLVVNAAEARSVLRIFELYRELGNVAQLRAYMKSEGIVSKVRHQRNGAMRGGVVPSTGALFAMLGNRIYRGEIAHKGKVHPGQHPAIIPPDLWDAVQTVRQRTSQRRTTRAQASNPLRGLIVDGEGQAFEPVHTTKGGQRYRYYVTKRNEAPTEETIKLLRLPARELETHVANTLSNFLADEEAILKAVIAPEDPAAYRTTVLEGAAGLAKNDVRERWDVFRPLIHKIVVRPDRIDLVVEAQHLRHVLLGIDEAHTDLASTLTLTIPVALHRTGHDLRLVVNNGPTAGEAGRQDVALLKLIARGQQWYKQLTTGERSSLKTIADAEGLSERHVSRIISGSLLAPDIVEKIAQGRHPIRFSVGSLKLRPPVLWDEQRRLFDMPL